MNVQVGSTNITDQARDVLFTQRDSFAEMCERVSYNKISATGFAFENMNTIYLLSALNWYLFNIDITHVENISCNYERCNLYQYYVLQNHKIKLSLRTNDATRGCSFFEKIRYFEYNLSAMYARLLLNSTKNECFIWIFNKFFFSFPQFSVERDISLPSSFFLYTIVVSSALK